MSFIDLKLLILIQIGIDIAIIVVFVFLVKRLRHLNSDKRDTLDKAVKIFESVLTDADKMAGQFSEQMEEKHHLIKKFNDQLDKKVLSLNLLLNRADVMLNMDGQTVDTHAQKVSLNRQEAEIIRLSKEGHDLENIASKLSIPKEEVRLVLGLKKKLSQMVRKEGFS